MFLLGLLPILKDGDPTIRSRIFYECLKVLFDLVIRYTDGEGLDVTYADGLIRRYFLIIIVVYIDYEEQVKLTSVKANTHYTIYRVLPSERKDLEG